MKHLILASLLLVGCGDVEKKLQDVGLVRPDTVGFWMRIEPYGGDHYVVRYSFDSLVWENATKVYYLSDRPSWATRDFPMIARGKDRHTLESFVIGQTCELFKKYNNAQDAYWARIQSLLTDSAYAAEKKREGMRDGPTATDTQVFRLDDCIPPMGVK